MAYRASTSDALREELETLARRAFAFLTEKNSYTGPQVASEPATTIMSYRKGELGIEIEFDWRDRDVTVLLVRLTSGGETPDGYYVSGGKFVRVRMLNWLWRQGLYAREPARKEADHRSAPEQIEEMIRFYASVLEKHLPEIERRGSAVFDGR